MSQAPSSSAYDTVIHDAITQANADYGVSIPENVFRQVIWSESSFNPAAQSGTGYNGIAQLGKAAIQDIMGSNVDASAIQYDPNASINVAAQYLAKLVRNTGGLRSGLVSYKGYGGAESQAYADQVLIDSGYGNIAADTSWYDKYVSPVFSNRPKQSATNPATSQTQAKPAEWNSIQRYAASGAALVLGVGLLLVIAGKDTLNTLSKKAIA